MIIIKTTSDSHKTIKLIANTLLNKKYAACINIVPRMRSKYIWEGRIAESRETMLLIKTVDKMEESVYKTIKELQNKKALEMGFPVALKILSDDITHKSDVGGVALHLNDEDAVLTAANGMLKNIGRRFPDAQIQGFTVQRMVSRPGAHEVIIGTAPDPVFGPVILFGHGGTAVEVIGDRSIALPPLNMKLAQDLMLLE